MDTFLATHWSQLQTALWFYSRSRLIVRLAAHSRPRAHDLHGDPDDPAGFGDDPDPIAELVMPGGRIRKRWLSRSCTDLSFEDVEEQVLDALRRGRLRAAGRKNGQGSRERILHDEWPGLQFYWDKPLPEMSYLPPAVRSSRHYVGPCNRHSYLDVPYWTDLLFEREEVLALRPDPIRELLRTTTEPITLARAVALLVRERPASKEVWARLRHKHGGRFPAMIKQRIENVGSELIGMLRKGEIAARGRFCDRDEGTEGKDRQPISAEFLDELLWFDPCTDGIWTEPDLRDGRFNPIDRGYRDILLKGAQFPETQETVTIREAEAAALTLSEGSPSRIVHAEPWLIDMISKVQAGKRKLPGGKAAWKTYRSEGGRLPRESFLQRYKDKVRTSGLQVAEPGRPPRDK